MDPSSQASRDALPYHYTAYIHIYIYMDLYAHIDIYIGSRWTPSIKHRGLAYHYTISV